MNIFEEFITTYGTTILYTVLTAVAGYLGMVLKGLVTKYFNDKTKQNVAKTCVKAVEQLYHNLGGEDKLSKALSNASEMLSTKGISVTDLELRMLIEAAVSEFNYAFKGKTDGDHASGDTE